MRFARLLPLLALSTLAGCQILGDRPAGPPADLSRLQGELARQGDRWMLRTCDQRSYSVAPGADSTVLQDAQAMMGDRHALFADLSGSLGGTTAAEADGELTVQDFYRLERESAGCSTPDFRRLVLHAQGDESTWSVNVTSGGMVVAQGEKVLALPYLEEQLPDGPLSLTSEADGQHIELWVTRQRCTEAATENLYALAAELRVDGAVHRGCAYYGGLRQH